MVIIMKKLLVLLAALAAMTFVMTSCGSEGTESGTSSVAQTGAGYEFKANGVTVAMDAKAADLVDKLGEYEYFEAPSCAFQGLDKTYTYAGFELVTYQQGEVDHVLSVSLLDDSLTTPEGVTIGSSLDDVKKAYGDSFTQDGSSYKYKKGNTILTFIVEDDAVTSVEYKADVE